MIKNYYPLQFSWNFFSHPVAFFKLHPPNVLNNKLKETFPIELNFRAIIGKFGNITTFLFIPRVNIKSFCNVIDVFV